MKTIRSIKIAAVGLALISSSYAFTKCKDSCCAPRLVKGRQGPQGPQGTSIYNVYGSWYSTLAVGAPAAGGVSTIAFNNVNVVTSGIALSSDNKTFTFAQAGSYKIKYTAVVQVTTTPAAPGQLPVYLQLYDANAPTPALIPHTDFYTAPYINLLPGTASSPAIDYVQIKGFAIVQAEANQQLQVQISTALAQVVDPLNPSNILPNATISIELLPGGQAAI